MFKPIDTEVTFIGTKLIKAKTMTRAQYNEYRNWELPADEDGSDPGYLVEYVDGGPSNHPDHEGYISWSPANVFEEAYEPVQNMSFAHAMHLVQRGYRVARSGWNGKGMFIFLVPGSRFEVNRPPLLGIYPEGTAITYGSHIDIKAADGRVFPWLASQDDMNSNDWNLV